jgi:hypothetical protein
VNCSVGAAFPVLSLPALPVPGIVPGSLSNGSKGSRDSNDFYEFIYFPNFLIHLPCRLSSPCRAVALAKAGALRPLTTFPMFYAS